MSLVSDIITQSFLDLGAIAPGEGITDAEETDAFGRLNQMVATWSTEQLTVYTVIHQSFTLTAGTDAYTLGAAGSLETAGGVVPVRITSAASVSGNFRSPVKVVSFQTLTEMASDPLASTSVLAKLLAADNGWPSIGVRVFPMPAASPGSLQLDYWTAITAFAGVGSTVSLPPGFEAALHWSLAVELWPQYARPGNSIDIIAANATKAKAAIVALTAQVLGLPAAGAPAAGGGQ